MRNHPASRSTRRRGVAMVLVMLAVAFGAVLSYAYLMGQSTSAKVAGNAASKAQARAIAEAALGLAVYYVKTHDTWRTDKLPGEWATNQPLGGGTFTVRGDDGEDTNGDGIVEGDGSFTDDTLDMLTLTATGAYRGTQHTVRAVVPPNKVAMMLVPNPSSMTAEDTDRYTLLGNWAWKVRLLKASGTAADFTAAASGAHVIYVPAHCNPGSSVIDQLKATDLPIVSEDINLPSATKVASSGGRTWTGTSIDVPQLTRTVTDDAGNESTQVYTNYITSVFPVGSQTICNRSATLLYVDGDTIGAQALATRTGQPTQSALLILEAGALGSDKRPSRARRVILPWGGANNTFSISSLNTNGQTVLRRSLYWAGSSWRGCLPGIAVWNTVEVKDLGTVDGYNSTLGAYGGANVNGLSTMSNNAVAGNCIKLSGGLVKCNVFVSPDADLNQVVNVASGASLTGVCRKLSLNAPALTPQAPQNMGGSIGDRTYSLGTYIASGDIHFGKLTICGFTTIRVSGATRIYCDRGLTISQGGSLTLATDASLMLYTAGDVTIKDAGTLNMAFGCPAMVQWYIMKGKVQLQGSAQACAQIQTYDGVMEVHDLSSFFGTFIGKSLTVSNSGAFHVDTSCSGTIVTLGGGFDLARIVSSGTRWVEMH
jgi:hypothetical protein